MCLVHAKQLLRKTALTWCHINLVNCSTSTKPSSNSRAQSFRSGRRAEGQLNVLHTWSPSCCLYPRNKSLLILIHFWQASLKKRSFLKASLLRGQLIADWMFLFLQASSINQNTLAQSNPARVTGDEF